MVPGVSEVPGIPDIRRAALATDPLEVPRRLPRGIGGLPQDVVLLSQRARLVEGTARAVADKGYAAATVADIIGHAGVSRATFYQFYKDKEDCFLSCLEGLAQANHAVVEEALARHGDEDLPAALTDALQAYLSRIDANPSFARAFIAEAQGATPRIRAAFDAARDRLDGVVRGWYARVRQAYPDVPPCADDTHRLLQAALEGYVITRIRDGALPLASQAPVIATLIFAGLGLYRWAEAARQREPAHGKPRKAKG